MSEARMQAMQMQMNRLQAELDTAATASKNLSADNQKLHIELDMLRMSSADALKAADLLAHLQKLLHGTHVHLSWREEGYYRALMYYADWQSKELTGDTLAAALAAMLESEDLTPPPDEKQAAWEKICGRLHWPTSHATDNYQIWSAGYDAAKENHA